MERHHAITSRQAGTVSDHLTRLQQRGLRSAALIAEKFGIIQAIHYRYDGTPLEGYSYPIPKGNGARRWKAFDSSADPKYAWSPTKPPGARYYYECDRAAFVQAFRDSDGRGWAVSGEPDVWAMHDAGIPHVFCWYGEASVPQTLAEDLKLLGIRDLHIAPDRDPTGLVFARKIRDLLDGSGITLHIHRLPGEDGSKNDIGACWKTYQEPIPFEAWLLLLPPLELPADSEPDPEQAARRNFDPSTLPADLRELYARWCEDVQAAAIQRWQISRANPQGWSRKNFSSPFRTDARPSARWDYQRHGFKDFGDGSYYNTHAVAAELEFISWEDCRADYFRSLDTRRPPASDSAALSTVHPRTVEPPSYLSRFALGMPYTISKQLLNLRRWLRKKDYRIYDQAAAALLLYVWQELVDYFSDDALFTIAEFERACTTIGRFVTRRMIEIGIAQLLAWGMVRQICTKCNLCILNESIESDRLKSPDAFCTNPDHVRRIFQFMPLDEQLENYRAHYLRMLEDATFKGVPGPISWDWGDLELTPQQIKLLEEDREEANRKHHHARENALKEFQKFAGYLKQNLACIRRSRYKAIKLPSGPLRNSAAYREALWLLDLDAKDGQRENANSMQWELGVHRSTLHRMRKKHQVITQRRTKWIWIDELTDLHRTQKRIVTERPDSDEVEITIASAEIRLRQASIEEAKEFDAMCRSAAYFASQRKKLAEEQKLYAENVAARIPVENPLKDEPSAFDIPDPDDPLTIPARHFDDYLMAQLRYQSSAVYACDEETGEMLPPAVLIRLTAERLAAT
jgi:hypothetical protein